MGQDGRRGLYGTEKKVRKSISRKKLLGVALASIVTLGFLFVYNYGFPATSFHFELRYPQHVPKSSVFISIGGLYDCMLNISFIDDPDLVYMMDIILSESAFAKDAFTLHVDTTWDRGGGQVTVGFSGFLGLQAATRVLVDEVHLVLGSATPYGIGVSGSDVTGTVSFGSNMTGSESYLSYRATGPTLDLIFTEDMAFFNTGMEVLVVDNDKPDYVNLFVDLPDGVNGTLWTDSVLDIEYVNGWTYRPVIFPPDVTKYSTDESDSEPLLSLSVRAVYMVRAWLID